MARKTAEEILHGRIGMISDITERRDLLNGLNYQLYRAGRGEITRKRAIDTIRRKVNKALVEQEILSSHVEKVYALMVRYVGKDWYACSKIIWGLTVRLNSGKPLHPQNDS